MECLECKNLVKRYGKKDVLDNINLTIEKGKIYGLIGRNGAGKTTLLSLLASHSAATSGEALFNGEAIWENRKALDNICFSRELQVTDQSGLGNLRVKDYLKAASLYFPKWDEEYAKELINKFELDSKKKLSKLSKGMLSMVTIIVGLASKAEYTFLDEPVAGIDVVARDYFYKMLLDEYANTGRTFIISTHIIEEAQNLFEEVIMIKDGKLLLKENTQELLDRCYTVSGLEEEVDKATEGLTIFNPETIGRRKSVTVMLKDGEKLHDNGEINVEPINLQNLFVAMNGMNSSIGNLEKIKSKLAV